MTDDHHDYVNITDTIQPPKRKLRYFLADIFWQIRLLLVALTIIAICVVSYVFAVSD